MGRWLRAISHLLFLLVVPLLAEGTIRPVSDRVYKMERIREAHARLESNESFGKIVLLIE
jgi:NADPH:quinone reductase-like Zn-dependent oxidoreductase